MDLYRKIVVQVQIPIRHDHLESQTLQRLNPNQNCTSGPRNLDLHVALGKFNNFSRREPYHLLLGSYFAELRCQRGHLIHHSNVPFISPIFNPQVLFTPFVSIATYARIYTSNTSYSNKIIFLFTSNAAAHLTSSSSPPIISKKDSQEISNGVCRCKRDDFLLISFSSNCRNGSRFAPVYSCISHASMSKLSSVYNMGFLQPFIACTLSSSWVHGGAKCYSEKRGNLIGYQIPIKHLWPLMLSFQQKIRYCKKKSIIQAAVKAVISDFLPLQFCYKREKRRLYLIGHCFHCCWPECSSITCLEWKFSSLAYYFVCWVEAQRQGCSISIKVGPRRKSTL